MPKFSHAALALTALLGVATLAAPANAQSAPSGQAVQLAAADGASPPPKAGKHKKSLTFASIDTNNDGKITPDEFAAAAKHRKRLANRPKLFARIDTNHDGAISKDEFDGWLAKHPGKKAKKPAGAPADGSSGS